jgi:quercetin dioxygenase-like cupin family protein
MHVEKIKPSFIDGRGEIIDILKKSVVEYATIITSRKGAVRANHYHKETFQYVYMMSGRMRVVAQMPGEQASEVVIEAGDLIVNAPLERHAFEALEDSTMLVLTRGPRGGEDYESDTFRLEVPLIPAKQASSVGA